MTVQNQIQLNKFMLRLEIERDKLERLDRVRLKYPQPITALESIRQKILDDIATLEKKVVVFLS